MTSVAPKRSTLSRRDSSGSDTTMRAAPKARAAWAHITPIGPGAGDEDRTARVTTCALRIVVTATDSGSSSAAASSDMESGTGMGHLGVDGDVAAERAVDRRGGVELHVGTQVVAPRGALFATPARMLRLDRDPLTDPGRVDLLADRRDAPRQLVAEDHRLFDDEVTDPPVPVVVHVGSADADRRDLDEDLVWSGRAGPAGPRSAACRRPVITLARIVVVAVVICVLHLPFGGGRAGPGRRPSAGRRQRRTAAQSPR